MLSNFSFDSELEAFTDYDFYLRASRDHKFHYDRNPSVIYIVDKSRKNQMINNPERYLAYFSLI